MTDCHLPTSFHVIFWNVYLTTHKVLIISQRCFVPKFVCSQYLALEKNPRPLKSVWQTYLVSTTWHKVPIGLTSWSGVCRCPYVRPSVVVNFFFKLHLFLNHQSNYIYNPFVVPFPNCSNGSTPVHIGTKKGVIFKTNLLIQWSNFKIILHKCSLNGSLPSGRSLPHGPAILYWCPFRFIQMLLLHCTSEPKREKYERRIKDSIKAKIRQMAFEEVIA